MCSIETYWNYFFRLIYVHVIYMCICIYIHNNVRIYICYSYLLHLEEKYKMESAGEGQTTRQWSSDATSVTYPKQTLGFLRLMTSHSHAGVSLHFRGALGHISWFRSGWDILCNSAQTQCWKRCLLLNFTSLDDFGGSFHLVSCSKTVTPEESRSENWKIEVIRNVHPCAWYM